MLQTGEFGPESTAIFGQIEEFILRLEKENAGIEADNNLIKKENSKYELRVAKNREQAKAIEKQIDQVATELTGQMVEFEQLRAKQTNPKVINSGKKVEKNTKELIEYVKELTD